MRILAITDWWEFLTTPEKVFWLIAIVFSFLFLVQFVASLLGLDSDTDIDSPDIDMDSEFGHAEAGYDIDPSFTILSVRGVIAFFTFFGWTGVYLLNQGWGTVPAIGMGMVTGLAAMFVVAYMIFQFARLEKSGTARVYDALREEGEVYLSIPESGKGTGKVHIRLNGVLREFDALTEGDPIQTGEQIEVIDVLENNVLLVKPLLKLEGGITGEGMDL